MPRGWAHAIAYGMIDTGPTTTTAPGCTWREIKSCTTAPSTIPMATTKAASPYKLNVQSAGQMAR